jgi:hypothetical protein
MKFRPKRCNLAPQYEIVGVRGIPKYKNKRKLQENRKSGTTGNMNRRSESPHDTTNRGRAQECQSRNNELNQENRNEVRYYRQHEPILISGGMPTERSTTGPRTATRELSETESPVATGTTGVDFLNWTSDEVDRTSKLWLPQNRAGHHYVGRRNNNTRKWIEEHSTAPLRCSEHTR